MSEIKKDLTLSSLRIDPTSDNASIMALDVEGPVSMTKTLAVTGAATVTGALTCSSTFQGHKRPVETIVDLGAAGVVAATCTAAKSGTIYLVPALTTGTQTIELPAAADAVGCTYTFVATDTVGQDFDVTTNGSEKILGAVSAGDGDNLAASDANDSIGFDANAIIGSRFSVTCISSTAGTAFIAHDILDGLAANTGGINLK
jgi:hypothetical protein